MKQYVDLIKRIKEEGHQSDDRTGTGTIKIFGHQSTYDMDDGFPLLTLKKTWMPGVTHELLWFLGNHTKLEPYSELSMTNIKYLVDNKVHIWDEWATEDGDLGPVYGQQWVSWRKASHVSMFSGDLLKPSKHNPRIAYDYINQIQEVIDKLTEGSDNFNPMDRGLIVSAWNVAELNDMALRPCHAFFQFQARELTLDERIEFCGVENFSMNPTSTFQETCDKYNTPKYELSLQLYQRSADTFLGVPFNIASYALLLHMVCHVTGMKPGKFVHTFGDAHLYSNHEKQVEEFLSRVDGDNYGPKLPSLWLNPEIKNIFDFQYDDIKVIDYNPLPHISAPVAV